MTAADLSRRAFAVSLGAGIPLLAGAPAFAANTAAPGKTWTRFPTLQSAGLDAQKMAAMEHSLYERPTTSMMVVKGGKVAYTYGDVAAVSYLASARKSLLSMLYGKYVESGVIDLNTTIAQLGITENSDLLPIEKTATIRDLLTSSSGVYWPAGSPGGQEDTPARGSKTPGQYFHYNNWDFNVAGEAFQRLTKKTVFQAFEEDLAKPLGFEDFDITRQRMLGYESDPSRYKAYHLFLSGRDMARLGQVMINDGQWNGRQVVPAKWVKESTAVHVTAAGTQSELGYGYLWWLPSETRKSPAWAGSFLANGHFGQFILGLPALDMVIVHRRAVPDEAAIARNLGKTNAAVPAVSATEFLKVADMVVAANAP